MCLGAGGRVGRTRLGPLNYIKGRNKEGRGPEKEEGILRREKKKSFTLVDHYDNKEVDERKNRIKRKRGNNKERRRRGRRRDRRMWWGRRRLMTWGRKEGHNKKDKGLVIHCQFV